MGVARPALRRFYNYDIQAIFPPRQDKCTFDIYIESQIVIIRTTVFSIESSTYFATFFAICFLFGFIIFMDTLFSDKVLASKYFVLSFS